MAPQPKIRQAADPSESTAKTEPEVSSPHAPSVSKTARIDVAAAQVGPVAPIIHFKISGTAQLKQYHPISVELGLSIPAELDKPLEESIATVVEIVEGAFDAAFSKQCALGFRWKIGKPALD